MHYFEDAIETSLNEHIKSLEAAFQAGEEEIWDLQVMALIQVYPTKADMLAL